MCHIVTSNLKHKQRRTTTVQLSQRRGCLLFLGRIQHYIKRILTLKRQNRFDFLSCWVYGLQKAVVKEMKSRRKQRKKNLVSNVTENENAINQNSSRLSYTAEGSTERIQRCYWLSVADAERLIHLLCAVNWTLVLPGNRVSDVSGQNIVAGLLKDLLGWNTDIISPQLLQWGITFSLLWFKNKQMACLSPFYIKILI